MAPGVSNADLPLNADGQCMCCSKAPQEFECLRCSSCASPWHQTCLRKTPSIEQVGDLTVWLCPDCKPALPDEGDSGGGAPANAIGDEETVKLMEKMKEIEGDGNLSTKEKAQKRQELMGGAVQNGGGEGEKVKNRLASDVLDEKMKCAFCLRLVDRPVTVSGKFGKFREYFFVKLRTYYG